MAEIPAMGTFVFQRHELDVISEQAAAMIIQPVAQQRYRCGTLLAWRGPATTWARRMEERPMATIPLGQQARWLLQLTCPHGHPLGVYGPDERTAWTGLIAPRCVKCGQEFVDVRPVAALDHNPAHRYLVRRRVAGLVFEAEVAADRFETTDGVVTFYTGPHRVSSSAQLVADPEPLDG